MKTFFFGLHLILGRKTDLVLGWKIFIPVFTILKFSEFPAPPPPPFQKSCVRSEWGPWYFGDFRIIFMPNIGEDPINVLPSERGMPHTVPYGKCDPGYCIMLIKKVRLEPEVATF